MAVRKNSHPDSQESSTGVSEMTPAKLERLLRETDTAIAEWEAENGPIPEDVLAEVRPSGTMPALLADAGVLIAASRNDARA